MLNSSSTPESPTTRHGWTPSEVKAALGKGGIARIARRAGVTNGGVSHVIAGRNRARKIEAKIAQALHVPANEIFPIRKEDPIPDLQPVVGATPKGAAA